MFSSPAPPPLFFRVGDSWSIWIALILLPEKKFQRNPFLNSKSSVVVGGIHLASWFECTWGGRIISFLFPEDLRVLLLLFFAFSQSERSVIIPDPTAFVGIVGMRGFRWSSWTVVGGKWESFLFKYKIKILDTIFSCANGISRFRDFVIICVVLDFGLLIFFGFSIKYWSIWAILHMYMYFGFLQCP